MLLPLLIILFSFGRFTGGVDVDQDIEGNIYAVDRLGNAIVKYSPQGDSLRTVSGFGNGSLQFDAPVAVYARKGNDVFVADYNNHRVQRFDRQLDYITTIYTRDDPDPRKRFGYPRDVTVTRQGDVLIVDGENHRIIKFNAQGQVESIFGDVNAGAGRLVDPMRIEVDSEDNAYVLDRGRLVMFDPFGGYVRDMLEPVAKTARSISIERDTLVVTDSASVVLYDLKTRSYVAEYQLPFPARSVEFFGDMFLAIEEHRINVYRPDTTSQE